MNLAYGVVRFRLAPVLLVAAPGLVRLVVGIVVQMGDCTR
jgi:hypothetical protein